MTRESIPMSSASSSHAPLTEWKISRSGRPLTLDRPRILGILNLTPDSFSDANPHRTIDDAVRTAERMLREGADALDLGGESTRPGAAPVDADEQKRRVIPVLRAIRAQLGSAFPITIDTMLAAVAAAALDEGADAVNDVSAATHDTAMLPLIASRGAGVILMHRLTRPANDSYSHQYNGPPDYGPGGVVRAVCDHLAARAEFARDAGVPASQIMLDPGLGFGKTVRQNLALIDATPQIAALGYPVLSGISRKSFTAAAAGLSTEAPPQDRLHPTLALSVLHLTRGARLFRVHDVAAHAQALRAAWAAFHTTEETPRETP